MTGTMAFQVLSGGPILAVSDFAASLAFYTDGLGFTVDARFDDPSFAILSNGPVGLCLAEQGHPAGDLPGYVMTTPPDPTRMAVVLVLRVDDVRAVHTELVARGVSFASEVWSPPWGGGRCFARDPDGFLVEIETLS
jgi:catechol 2,3-dioxygenase-like lactoylglutathione lyase family enzyme